MTCVLRLIAGLSLLFGALPVWSAPPGGDFQEKLATPALLAQLREGGFVIYMRHGTTDPGRPDQVPLNLNDCATQRPLTAEGRELAATVGRAIRKAGIRIESVVSSPLCRAKESAQAAFGAGYTVNAQLMYTSNLTSAEKKPIVDTTRQLLSLPVAAGGNRVIVAHAPNLADLMGYFPRQEATVVVFSPQGEQGFEYVASILPAQWPQLLSGSHK